MSNPYYNPSGNPTTASEGLSALMRNEFISIGTAFSLIPPFLATGAYVTTFAQVGSFTFTLPSATGTLATTANVATETTRATAAEGVNATAIATEATARAAAITTEATARAAADTTEATTRASAITTEASARSTADALLAPKASPTFTGVPAAPTATTGTNTTQLATTSFVNASVAAATTGVSSVNTRTGAIVISSGDVTSALGFTPVQQGTGIGQMTDLVAIGWSGSKTKITIDTFDQGNIAMEPWTTTAIGVETSRATTAEALLAPKASPTFTGAPAAPTASLGTSTTQLSTTAFVGAAINAQYSTIHTVSSSRAFSTTYTNSTGGPMFLTIQVTEPTSALPMVVDLFITINGTQAWYSSSNVANGVGVYGTSGSVMVPAGATYSAVSHATAPTATWTETY